MLSFVDEDKEENDLWWYDNDILLTWFGLIDSKEDCCFVPSKDRTIGDFVLNFFWLKDGVFGVLPIDKVFLWYKGLRISNCFGWGDDCIRKEDEDSISFDEFDDWVVWEDSLL